MVHVFGDLEGLSAAAAREIARVLTTAAHARGRADVHRSPAALLRQATGMITWWVDKAAHGTR